jgi:hypothetical protein
MNEVKKMAKRTTKGPDTLPVSVDIVLLTVKDGGLYAALAPRAGEFLHGVPALVASTIHTNEDQHLEETVRRTLRERGGLNDIYVEQLYTWGDATRDSRGWSIAIGYFGLVPIDRLEAAEKQLEFRPVDHLGELPFDHNKIINTAVWRIRGKGGYSTIPARLLPEEFSLGQMQTMYEAVLGRKLDTSSFRRKVEVLGLVEETGEVKSIKDEGRLRPSKMYRLNHLEIDTFDRTL